LSDWIKAAQTDGTKPATEENSASYKIEDESRVALGAVQKVPGAVASALEHDGPTLIEAPCPQALPPWIESA
jgi:hypothetical protein